MSETKPPVYLATYVTVGLGHNTEGAAKVVLTVSGGTLGITPSEAKRVAVQLLIAADELEAREKENADCGTPDEQP